MTNQITILLKDFGHPPFDFRVNSGVLGTFNSTVYGNLLRLNMDFEVLPGLIKSWSYDFKSKTYRLSLGDHKFHNGRQVTADDLEFSIVRGFLSKQLNYARIHFSDIIGIEKLSPGTMYKPGLVPGIRIVDPRTIDITLRAPNPIFLTNLAVPFVPLVPREELKEDYFTWKTLPVGAGPYKVEDYANGRLKLVSVNKEPGRPGNIVIDSKNLLEHYDIKFHGEQSNANKDEYENVLSKYPSTISCLQFYAKNPLVQNINFRKMLYHLIDRDALVLGSIERKPAYQMLTQPYGGRLNAKNPFDIGLAKQFAEKLPKSVFGQVIKIAVFHPLPFPPELTHRLENLKAQFARMDLRVEFESRVEKFPLDEDAKKYVAMMAGKVIDLADPVVSYGAYSSVSPYRDFNPSTTGEYEKAYRKAVESSDIEERHKAVQSIAKIVEDEALVVPLLAVHALYKINPKTIKSLGEQPQPLFLDLSKVEMK